MVYLGGRNEEKCKRTKGNSEETEKGFKITM